MKILSVAIAAMFAGGILLGQLAFVAHHAASRPFLLTIAASALRRQKNLLRWQSGALALFIACVSAAIAIYPFPPAVHANELEVIVLDVPRSVSGRILAKKPCRVTYGPEVSKNLTPLR